jgi:capsid protein
MMNTPRADLPTILDARGRPAVRQQGDSRRTQPRGFYMHGGYQAAAFATSRSYIPGDVTDSRRELTSYPRTEMVRKARYFKKNIGMARGVGKSLVDHAIGPGIYPIPATSNDTWNELAWNWFWEVAKIAEVTGKMTLWETQRKRTEAKFWDGEMFTILLQSRDGWPQYQTIRCHNCGNFDLGEEANKGWVDGVKLDRIGRPRAYRFALRDEGRFATVEARNVVHSYILEETDQVRGVTPLAAAINNLHDVMDTIALEKETMKSLSRRAAIVTNTSGTDEEEAERSHFTSDGDDPYHPDPDVQEKLKKVLGSEVTYLGPNESLKAFEFNRPGPQFIAFINYIGRDITIGSGFPYEFAWDPSGIPSAAVRFVLEKVRVACDEWRRNEIEDTLPFYTQAISWAMEVGELPWNPEWWKVDWLPGAEDVTIDKGRDAASAINAVKAALLNFKRYFARQGLWWKTELRQKAVEASFIKNLAKEFGVPEDRIHQLTVNSGATSGDEAGDRRDPPEDEEQEKERTNR